MWQTRRLYFFGDEWAFLLDRRLAWDDVFVPHNEHWSTLPLIAYRIMFHLFGIDHHLAYGLMPILLHVGICVVVYVLMRRHGIGSWSAVLATLLLAFLCGNAAENPLWPFQIGFLGSAFLGLAALLVYDVVDRPAARIFATWLLMVAAMACSGMALPMLVLLGLYVLLSKGLVRALTVTVPPSLVYLLWYALWGRDATAQAPDAGVSQWLDFAGTGLAQLWEAVFRLPDVGGAILLVLLVTALALPVPRRTRWLTLSGVLGCIAMYALLSVSRAGLGIEAARASRYAYFGIMMTLPAFASLLSQVAVRIRESRLQTGAYVVSLVALAVSGSAQTVAFTDGRLTLTPGLEQRVLGAAQLAEDEVPLLGAHPEPTYSPNITVDALKRPEVAAALPDHPPSPQGLLDAAVWLQVASSRQPLDLDNADVGMHGVRTSSSDGADVSGAGDRCTRLRAGAAAYLDLVPSPDGGQMLLRGLTQPVSVQLIAGNQVSVPVQLATWSGTYVGSTAEDATLRVNLPVGAFHLCRIPR